MPEKPDHVLPKNATEAQGLLIKSFYEKYGDDILPVVEDILGRQGRALGLKLHAQLSDPRLSAVGAAFSKNFNPADVDVAEISDHRFQIRGNSCPFGLENTSRKLCEAVMAIDREYFFAATGGKTTLRILKTRAAGDPVCDTVYTVE